MLKHLLLLSAANTLFGAASLAQDIDLGPPIALSNGSFEDRPRQNHPPKGWYDCGFPGESPVDVHPASALEPDTGAFFGVTALAVDGNTYLGMVVRDNETYESVSQRIVGGPLEGGKCYTFSIYLARAPEYNSLSRSSNTQVNYDTPAKLQIYGGPSYCTPGELLAESEPVGNSAWEQYNFRFEPKADVGYITLQAYYKTPALYAYNGNLLLDAASRIIPLPCDEETLAEVPLDDDAVAEATPEVAAPPAAEAPAPATPSPTAPPTPEPPVATIPTPSTGKAKLQGLSRADLRAGSVVRVEKLFFKADSSTVTDVSLPVLEEIYTFLSDNPDVVIEVGGHTNSIPPANFCDALSKARAEAVVEYLVARGIAQDRLYAKGYGKRKPIATNRTVAGRRRNQRVELRILSMG